MTITYNLNDFKSRELTLASEILSLLSEGAITPRAAQYFNFESETKLCFNQDSGYVFLTNEDYDCLVVAGNDESGTKELDLWLNLPDSGAEGFYDDLMQEDNLSDDDLNYLASFAL